MSRRMSGEIPGPARLVRAGGWCCGWAVVAGLVWPLGSHQQQPRRTIFLSLECSSAFLGGGLAGNPEEPLPEPVFEVFDFTLGPRGNAPFIQAFEDGRKFAHKHAVQGAEEFPHTGPRCFEDLAALDHPSMIEFEAEFLPQGLARFKAVGRSRSSSATSWAKNHLTNAWTSTRPHVKPGQPAALARRRAAIGMPHVLEACAMLVKNFDC